MPRKVPPVPAYHPEPILYAVHRAVGLPDVAPDHRSALVNGPNPAADVAADLDANIAAVTGPTNTGRNRDDLDVRTTRTNGHR